MIDPKVITRFRELIAKGLTIEEAALACGISRDEASEIWRSAKIKDGREGETSTKLDQLIEYYNERFFVVGNMGGKCRLLWHEDDPAMPGRKVLGVQTFADFRNRFDNIEIEIPVNKGGKWETQNKPQGSAWLDHYARRQFDTITFAPNQDLGRKVYNLWRGFRFKPTEGDCSLFLAHVRDNICAGDDMLYEWVVSWLAYAVQHPDEPGRTALAMRGQKGTGKNFFADTFGKLWGNHYLAVSEPEHVTGRFNSHLRECCVLFANEAFFAGNPKHEQVLKTLITDDLLPVEQKFLDLVQARNFLHLILSSNSDWFIPTSVDERRFCVLDVSDEHREDKAYFAAIEKQLESGGYEALLFTLVHRDLSRFDPRSAPRTSALVKQVARSLKGSEAAWYQCLQLGTLPGHRDADGRLWLRGITFIEWAKKHDARLAGIKAEDLGHLFTKNGHDKRNRESEPMDFKKDTPVFRWRDRGGIEKTARVNAWHIPSLAECRKLWCQKRFDVRWSNVKDDWDVPDEPFEVF